MFTGWSSAAKTEVVTEAIMPVDRTAAIAPAISCFLIIIELLHGLFEIGRCSSLVGTSHTHLSKISATSNIVPCKYGFLSRLHKLRNRDEGVVYAKLQYQKVFGIAVPHSRVTEFERRKIKPGKDVQDPIRLNSTKTLNQQIGTINQESHDRSHQWSW
jgi:hypothetical protein